jgi:hypothetical protein
MRRLLAVVAPLALVACGAPAPPPPKEPPPIVEMPRRTAEPAQQAPSSEPSAPVPKAAPPPPTSVTVIDLGGPPVPPPAEPPATAAPAATPEKPDAGAIGEAKRLDRERSEQRVRDAEAKVAELEKRLLAIANPFLPRPELPPEEAQAWQGLDGVQRRDRVNKQLEEARKELEAAQAAAKEASDN